MTDDEAKALADLAARVEALEKSEASRTQAERAKTEAWARIMAPRSYGTGLYASELSRIKEK